MTLDDININKKERLAYIDFRVSFVGQIRRADLELKFGIKAAASTRDITTYRGLAPDNLVYDTSAKAYFRSDGFKPLFNFAVESILSFLIRGFGGIQKKIIGSSVSCLSSEIIEKPSIETLSILSRAIHLNNAITTTYVSAKNGKSVKELIPHAFVNSGQRWHVRAFDRSRNRFGDFVLTRFISPEIIESPILPKEEVANDIQWNRFVEMEIIPHPCLKHKTPIEMDYGIKKNKPLLVQVRAVQAGYFLLDKNIDCTEDHSLRSKDGKIGSKYRLWLKNPDKTLFKVDSAFMAPGFELSQ